MKKVVLFDLGGTLVQYYERSEFPDILQSAIAEVREFLCQKKISIPPLKTIWQRVEEENHEAPDCRVRPLKDRLARIFGLNDANQIDELKIGMCRCFMKPIFTLGRPYEDSIPALRDLKAKGIRTAIISNTPWGSPGDLWREEIKRHGLSELVDLIVFCTDVGWRKPARQIFDFALEKLKANLQECVFVGDNLRWDLAGPKALGMDAILIDRCGQMSGHPELLMPKLFRHALI